MRFNRLSNLITNHAPLRTARAWGARVRPRLATAVHTDILIALILHLRADLDITEAMADNPDHCGAAFCSTATLGCAPLLGATNIN
jgi:hypothetical protein